MLMNNQIDLGKFDRFVNVFFQLDEQLMSLAPATRRKLRFSAIACVLSLTITWFGIFTYLRLVESPFLGVIGSIIICCLLYILEAQLIQSFVEKKYQTWLGCIGIGLRIVIILFLSVLTAGTYATLFFADSINTFLDKEYIEQNTAAAQEYQTVVAKLETRQSETSNRLERLKGELETSLIRLAEIENNQEHLAREAAEHKAGMEAEEYGLEGSSQGQGIKYHTYRKEYERCVSQGNAYEKNATTLKEKITTLLQRIDKEELTLANMMADDQIILRLANENRQSKTISRRSTADMIAQSEALVSIAKDNPIYALQIAVIYLVLVSLELAGFIIAISSDYEETNILFKELSKYHLNWASDLISMEADEQSIMLQNSHYSRITALQREAENHSEEIEIITTLKGGNHHAA